ncbi:beta-N-acetylhexosaminidase [Colwelliaceae bacterium 6471]
MKINIIFYILLSFTFTLLPACNSGGSNVETNIVPKVNEIEAAKGQLAISATMNLIWEPGNEKVAEIANQFSDFIVQNTNIKQVNFNQAYDNSATKVSFQLINEEQSVNLEGYQLVIDEKGVVVSANSEIGLFYGTQSLKQILIDDSLQNKLPFLRITDAPSFGYRGMMLDVSRHFFTIAEVKTMLDLMAFYKLNTLHWHLTDDQGWRVEIDKYPLLTEIGSYRNETIVDKNFDPFIGDGISHSGFYTQAEIRDIVKYAQARYITIIPEIDMPGHMQAAIAAYPELACTDGPFEVSTRWGVHKDILCPKDITFTFLEDVLIEVMSLFPGRYVHIGGDEVPITRWQQSEVAQAFINANGLKDEHELQGYFYERMEQFLSQHGRQAIGWDEIQEKGIENATTITAWRDISFAKTAVRTGHQVILNTTDSTYFNYYQDDPASEPLAQCCMVTLKDVYNIQLLYTDLSEQENELIIGAQGSLWTEFIKTNTHLQYMLLPRMLALSEALWTNEANKNWSQFQQKLDKHYVYFDKNAINYHH